ncbi:hypothetical protein ASPWEDRAFT_45303 [Aspergillus wentii DTO 134E9]|uniref:N-acetyltransferase domain-containing protein n=1 Tax=Aspergillus wentii DTO 134E9 TaxID=1073089 RepID=A0A1L9R902_ASPWE|nr:uncharacterized protein ASPWEDRAFT_45303 [Aspergillus wentii DTO 134E9]KAI9926592.1 hypothetical protein MW887_004361 [Aspergillus wentii]OJJ31358.1 hypothetical protein ASPWEDRAFT_45303 [Aspergillus wentii DTO 134E9]
MDKQWHYQLGDENFTISTDPDILSHEFIQTSFASPAMYWATPVSSESLQLMIERSCFFGLYIKSPRLSTPNHSDIPITPQFIQIGMARLITDYVTVAYLADVFIIPQHQGKGLGKWLIQCIKEMVDSIPNLRRVMLMAKNVPHATNFYQELLAVQVYNQTDKKVVFMSS